jgi:hypothetical protein
MWSNFFRDGGWGMYPTMLFGIIAMASGFLFLFRPQLTSLRVVVVSGVLTFAAGLLGTSLGLIMTGRYLQSIAVDDRVAIAGLGVAESLNNLIPGLMMVIITALITFAGIVRGLMRPAVE